MDTARIADLLQPFLTCHPDRSRSVSDPSSLCHPDRSRSESDGEVEGPAVLSPAQLQSISTYIDLLLRWNSRINLTAIRDPEAIVTRHFGESLFAARALFPATTHVGTAAPGCPAERSSAPDRPPAVADLGSGAGFPGIPIKLWAPYISLTLIESNQKKATFLREVARTLTLTNVDIKADRAENLTGASFNVVTLRAVERFEAILPIAAGLVCPGGHLALLIGSAQQESAKSTLADFSWSSPQTIPLSSSRILLVGHFQGEPS